MEKIELYFAKLKKKVPVDVKNITVKKSARGTYYVLGAVKHNGEIMKASKFVSKEIAEKLMK